MNGTESRGKRVLKAILLFVALVIVYSIIVAAFDLDVSPGPFIGGILGICIVLSLAPNKKKDE